MLYVNCASVMESSVLDGDAGWVGLRQLLGWASWCVTVSFLWQLPGPLSQRQTACVTLGRGTCVIQRNILEVVTVFLFGSEVLFLVLHIIVEGTLKSKAPWLRETHSEEGKQTK